MLNVRSSSVSTIIGTVFSSSTSFTSSKTTSMKTLIYYDLIFRDTVIAKNRIVISKEPLIFIIKSFITIYRLENSFAIHSRQYDICRI